MISPLPPSDKKDFKRFLEVKVYHNRKNGQGIVLLPKKKMGVEIPKKVRISW